MSKSPTPTFGRRLKMARERAGLPQDRLGVLIDLDEGSASARMSRYENGIHEPNFDTIEKLAAILDVPSAYFFCHDDELAQVILRWPHLSIAEKKNILSRIE
jgi:transcriptional regulator with XRE-family HTH domain